MSIGEFGDDGASDWTWQIVWESDDLCTRSEIELVSDFVSMPHPFASVSATRVSGDLIHTSPVCFAAAAIPAEYRTPIDRRISDCQRKGCDFGDAPHSSLGQLSDGMTMMMYWIMMSVMRAFYVVLIV